MTGSSRSARSATTASRTPIQPASIVVRLATPGLFFTIEIGIDYRSAPGDVGAIGEAAQCEALQQVDESYFRHGQGKRIDISLASSRGIRGNASLVRCVFTPHETVLPSDFRVDAQARTADGARVIPSVVVLPD